MLAIPIPIIKLRPHPPLHPILGPKRPDSEQNLADDSEGSFFRLLSGPDRSGAPALYYNIDADDQDDEGLNTTDFLAHAVHQALQ